MRWMILLGVALAAPAMAASDAPAKTETADAKPKMVCKRETPIGSLVASKRTCHTAEDWRRIREDAQEQTGRMQQSGNGSTPQ